MSNAKRNIFFIKNKSDKVSIVLLAAGEPDRMKSFGVRSLIRLHNGNTLIENQLQIINNVFGNNETILITGYESDRLMNKTPDNLIKIENERYNDTNVARSLSIALRVINTNRVIVIYGDLMFNRECLEFPLEKSIATINTININENEVGCNIDSDNIELMLYGLNNKWGQIIYFTGKELDILKQLVWNRNNEKKFGFEIVNEIINMGGNIKAYINKNSKCYDIDSGKDIDKSRLIL